jgi:hypothetical protein
MKKFKKPKLKKVHKINLRDLIKLQNHCNPLLGDYQTGEKVVTFSGNIFRLKQNF